MMMGFGFWLMLVVLLVPILLVAGLALLVIKPVIRQFERDAGGLSANGTTGSPRRECGHCGEPLQANWAHCPHCGAPVED